MLKSESKKVDVLIKGSHAQLNHLLLVLLLPSKSVSIMELQEVFSSSIKMYSEYISSCNHPLLTVLASYD